MYSRPEHIESILRAYERYIAPFTFVIGFVFDAVALRGADLETTQIVLGAFLAVAALSIAVLALYESGRLRFRRADEAIAFVPVLMQFSFGNLFSAFTLFYTKSAAIGQSWIFLAMLVVILVGNERFRKRYERFAFRIAIFFVAVFSYAIFALPVALKRLDADIFLIAGAASAAAVAVFAVALAQFLPAGERRGPRAAAVAVGGIWAAFTVLYFTNVIPPIPLALQKSGVYHGVVRTLDGYAVRYEPAPRYLFLKETNTVFHRTAGEPVYYFSSVFAPTELAVGVRHQWLRYDERRKRWIREEEVAFPIVGGRDGGYRGYSFKTAVAPGWWRVEVVTDRGQVLGRETFRVVEVSSPPPLVSGLQ